MTITRPATAPVLADARSPFAHTCHTTLKVNCGCGVRFDTVRDGQDHAEATGHTLHIVGEIRAQHRG